MKGKVVSPQLNIDGERKTVDGYVTEGLRSNDLSDVDNWKVVGGNALHVLNAGF